jgi:hypothetical protein
MTGLGALVNGVLTDLSAELLIVVPAALGVAGLLWGAPKAVKFFKRLAS